MLQMSLETLINALRRRGSLKRGSSRYHGVYKVKGRCSWRAAIQVDGMTVHVASCKSEEEAAWAYDVAAVRAHRLQAVINFYWTDYLDLLGMHPTVHMPCALLVCPVGRVLGLRWIQIRNATSHQESTDICADQSCMQMMANRSLLRRRLLKRELQRIGCTTLRFCIKTRSSACMNSQQPTRMQLAAQGVQVCMLHLTTCSHSACETAVGTCLPQTVYGTD